MNATDKNSPGGHGLVRTNTDEYGRTADRTSAAQGEPWNPAPAVSAYVPCFNNADTLAQAIESIRAQRPPVAELFVVDDASTDCSVRVAEALGVRVIRHSENLGRGAVRARAMREACHDLVLCCDAGARLEPGFLKTALPWFNDPSAAAAFGRVEPSHRENTVERWRSRHLFKTWNIPPLLRRASLVTGGALMRKSLCGAAGGYNPALRHTEDADLGQRLLAAGYDVIADPDLRITCTVSNSLGQVLERYWRWNAGADESVSVHGYLKLVAYSIKSMATHDIRDGDPLSVPISLFVPHYQFWKSLWRKRHFLH